MYAVEEDTKLRAEGAVSNPFPLCPPRLCLNTRRTSSEVSYTLFESCALPPRRFNPKGENLRVHYSTLIDRGNFSPLYLTSVLTPFHSRSFYLNSLPKLRKSRPSSSTRAARTPSVSFHLISLSLPPEPGSLTLLLSIRR